MTSAVSALSSVIQPLSPHMIVTDDSSDPSDFSLKTLLSAAINTVPMFAVDSDNACPLRDLCLPAFGDVTSSSTEHGPMSTCYATDAAFQIFKLAVQVRPSVEHFSLSQTSSLNFVSCLFELHRYFPLLLRTLLVVTVPSAEGARGGNRALHCAC